MNHNRSIPHEDDPLEFDGQMDDPPDDRTAASDAELLFRMLPHMDHEAMTCPQHPAGTTDC